MGWFNFRIGERRRNPRIKPDGLTSAFAEVVDLSESGLCLYRQGDPSCTVGDTLTLDLCHEEAKFAVQATVTRVQAMGFRRHEIGLEFTEASAQVQPMLARLAQASEVEEQLGPQAWLAA